MYMLFYRGTFAESLERHESQYSQMASLNHNSPRRIANALHKGEEATARVGKRESADGSLSRPTTNDRVGRQRLSQGKNVSLSRPTTNDRVSRRGRKGR